MGHQAAFKAMVAAWEVKKPATLGGGSSGQQRSLSVKRRADADALVLRSRARMVDGQFR